MDDFSVEEGGERKELETVENNLIERKKKRRERLSRWKTKRD